jgi:hypothetical protein
MGIYKKGCMQNKTIKIEVYGGCVTKVAGLPDGYDYEIIDHDHLEEEKPDDFLDKQSNAEYYDSKC